MDKNTRVRTMKTLLTAAAELSADVARDLSEAAGAANNGEINQAVGSIIGTPEDLKRVEALVASVMALHTAREGA